MIGPQGLRDRAYDIPKPQGVPRILVVGDSVTFGLFVEREEVYTERLESLWAANGPGVEVLNAGVNGYTPYTEWQYYREFLRRFQADLVIVAFCMNDIVNPALHWKAQKEYFRDIPAGAFVDFQEHRRLIEPMLYGIRPQWIEWFRGSALYRDLENRWDLWIRRALRYHKTNGRSWPVYVADEMSPDIRVLTDRESGAWQWLGSVYDDFRRDVEADGARFAVLVLPLAYQLNEGYPYLPQNAFAEYAAEKGILLLDPLPFFREHRSEKIFMGRHRYHERDIWHLTPRGHELLAAFLASRLRDAVLLS